MASALLLLMMTNATMVARIPFLLAAALSTFGLACVTAAGDAPAEEPASTTSQAFTAPTAPSAAAPPATPATGGGACPSIARPTAQEVVEQAAVTSAEQAKNLADEAVRVADEAFRLAQRQATSAPSSAIAREAFEKASQALGRARSVVMQRQTELLARRAALKATTDLLDNLVGKCCTGAKYLTCLPLAVAIEILTNPGTCQAAEIERRPSCEAVAGELVNLQKALDDALTANAQNINAMSANNAACMMNGRDPVVCAELRERYKQVDDELQVLIPYLKAEVAAAQAELTFCAACQIAQENR